jgi:hypothetical protein
VTYDLLYRPPCHCNHCPSCGRPYYWGQPYWNGPFHTPMAQPCFMSGTSVAEWNSSPEQNQGQPPQVGQDPEGGLNHGHPWDPQGE